MNHTYNRAHDEAQRRARRHERDLRWATERRRQHERKIADARRLLAVKPIVAAGKVPPVTAALLLLIIGGYWAVQSARVPAVWLGDAQWLAVGLAVAVLVGAVSALRKVRARRDAARAILRTHAARVAHTQYHVVESVHSFVGARVDAHSTRETRLVLGGPAALR